MSNIIVSVQMVTYNHEKHIRKSIESVLSQNTNYNYELVIGEDCSTDNTRKIVFEYAVRFNNIIKVIFSEKNVGAKDNSERTFQACQGKYIAFCEGDDYWQNSSKLQMQVDFLEKNPDFGLIYSDYDVFIIKSKKKVENYIKTHKRYHVFENPSINDIITEKSRIQTCTVMMRRDLYQKIIESDPFLHQSGHFLMGDTQLWAEVSAVSKIGYIPISLATHNILAESASKSKNILKWLEFKISGLELMVYLATKYNIYESKDHFERKYLSYMLLQSYYTGNKKEAYTVREKINKLNNKEYLWYCGTMSKIANMILRFPVNFYVKHFLQRI